MGMVSSTTMIGLLWWLLYRVIKLTIIAKYSDKLFLSTKSTFVSWFLSDYKKTDSTEKAMFQEILTLLDRISIFSISCNGWKTIVYRVVALIFQQGRVKKLTQSIIAFENLNPCIFNRKDSIQSLSFCCQFQEIFIVHPCSVVVIHSWLIIFISYSRRK